MNRRRQLTRDTSGAVYVEYLVSAIPTFIMFLCLIQIMMAQMAHIVVQHAANMAARAAIVVLIDSDENLDDNGRPDQCWEHEVACHNEQRGSRYNGAPACRPGQNGNRNECLVNYDALPRKDRDPLYEVLDDGVDAENYDQPTSQANLRMHAILSAATKKTMAISPIWKNTRDTGESVKNAFNAHSDGQWRSRADFSEMADYATRATVVSVVANDTAVCSNDKVVCTTVHVGYQFRCAVPVAASIICGNLIPLEKPNGGTEFHGDRTSGNFSELRSELKGQYRLLMARATLPRPAQMYYVPGEHYP